MTAFSTTVFPENVLTQLHQYADAITHRIKSLIYMRRSSCWYVNSTGNYAVCAHITSDKNAHFRAYLTVRTGCYQAAYVYNTLPISLPKEISGRGRRQTFLFACRQAEHMAHLRYRFL